MTGPGLLASSIFINDSGRADAASLPPWLQENIRSLWDRHPALPHRLWGQDEVLALLAQRFSREVVQAFLALKPYAFRADLARYCVMHAHGGVYADLSYFLLRPLPLEPRRLVVFRDFLWSSPWDASNGVIAAPPGHRVFERAIEMVCANVRRGYLGPTPLCPTGPALFGQALAMGCEAQDLVTGAAALIERPILKTLVPRVELPVDDRLHALVLGQDVVAIKRKRMGSPGLAGFGVRDGNGYADLWARRDVYDPALRQALLSGHGAADVADAAGMAAGAAGDGEDAPPFVAPPASFDTLAVAPSLGRSGWVGRLRRLLARPGR